MKKLFFPKLSRKTHLGLDKEVDTHGGCVCVCVYVKGGGGFPAQETVQGEVRPDGVQMVGNKGRADDVDAAGAEEARSNGCGPNGV